MSTELHPDPTGTPTWYAQAACRGMDPAVFFPEHGNSHAEALEVCATCPADVRHACLVDAYQNNDTGVRGGTTWSWRRRHPRLVPILTRCRYCRTEFATPNRNSVYCSASCRRYAHSEKAAESYRAKVGQA